MIKRYNQGFGGFGPLVECDTGKLMKAVDVLFESFTLEARIADLEHENSVYRKQLLVCSGEFRLLDREDTLSIVKTLALTALVMVVVSTLALWYLS